MNKVTQFDPEPNAQIEDIIDRLGKAKYLSKVDLTKGYWQISLDDDAKVKSRLVTPFGYYHFTVMSFGMMQHWLVRTVLAEHTAFSGSFINDIIIFSECWESHIKHIQVVLSSLQKAGLTVNPKKCEFGACQLELLWRLVGNSQIQPKAEKKFRQSRIFPYQPRER